MPGGTQSLPGPRARSAHLPQSLKPGQLLSLCSYLGVSVDRLARQRQVPGSKVTAWTVNRQIAWFSLSFPGSAALALRRAVEVTFQRLGLFLPTLASLARP